jgi:hypothetical protein
MERMCEEAVLAEFEILFWYMPGQTEKNTKNLSEQSDCSSVLAVSRSFILHMSSYKCHIIRKKIKI